MSVHTTVRAPIGWLPTSTLEHQVNQVLPPLILQLPPGRHAQHLLPADLNRSQGLGVAPKLLPKEIEEEGAAAHGQEACNTWPADKYEDGGGSKLWKIPHLLVEPPPASSP